MTQVVTLSCGGTLAGGYPLGGESSVGVATPTPASWLLGLSAVASLAGFGRLRRRAG